MIDPAKIELYLGPPGTGKTTTLIRLVEEALADEVRPDQIAYLAFTRRAASEARGRAQERFNFSDKEMPWFRTIHSLAFKQNGSRAESLMHRNDCERVAASCGLEYKGDRVESDEDVYTAGSGDVMFFADNLARMTGEEAGQAMRRRFQTTLTELRALEVHLAHFSERLRAYKASEAKRDFTDILQEFVDTGVAPAIRILIVDEAQDLSKLQWKAIAKIAVKVERVIIAGDDDQAIYHWAGADVDYFMSLKAQSQTVLEQSYRVPRRVFQVAHRIISRVQHRKPKEYYPRDAEGTIQHVNNPDFLDASHGEWLFLTRHSYLINYLKRVCREHGWFYIDKDQWSNNNDHAKAVIAWTNLQRNLVTTRSHAALALDTAGWKDLAASTRSEHPQDFVSKAELPGPDWSKSWLDALTGLPSSARNYFRMARKVNESMTAKEPETDVLIPRRPRITISTIHGSKGAERPNVLLLSEVSLNTFKSSMRSEDEHRVFYTAVTRASERLVILRSGTDWHYEL